MNLIGSLFLKIIGSKKRESFSIGWLAEGKTLEELRAYLHREWGFGGNFSTHVDKGEVLNWRKLMEDGRQYHLRVYDDGESRGHVEMSPEKNVVSHITGSGKSDARYEFVNFLGDFVTKKKFVSNLVADTSVHNPDAEVLKEEQIS